MVKSSAGGGLREEASGAGSARIRFIVKPIEQVGVSILRLCLRVFVVKILPRKFSLILGAKVSMTYVVAEPCVNCRYTDCALVCPVEAFHLDDDMLVIHPETCIDCDACVPECPVEAIFAENNVPAEWTSFTPLNAERALSGLPTISARLDPLCE